MVIVRTLIIDNRAGLKRSVDLKSLSTQICEIGKIYVNSEKSILTFLKTPRRFSFFISILFRIFNFSFYSCGTNCSCYWNKKTNKKDREKVRRKQDIDSK
jgi:hypothetical protein